jgi:hypothetical protein
VLELSHETAVVSAQRPTIGVIDNKVGGHGQKRFHGENHSFVHDHPLTVVETWYGGVFVKAPSNPVPVEIPNNSKTVSTGMGLDRLADISKSVAALCRGHRVPLGDPRCFQEALRDRGNHSDGSTHTGVGKISVEFSGDIDINEIAFAQMTSEGRNTVSGFVVDTDARRTRKVVGHSRSRSCAVSSKGLATYCVEFPGSDSRLDSDDHRISGFGDNSTSPYQTFEIFVAIDRHDEILRFAIGCVRI